MQYRVWDQFDTICSVKTGYLTKQHAGWNLILIPRIDWILKPGHYILDGRGICDIPGIRKSVFRAGSYYIFFFFAIICTDELCKTGSVLMICWL